MRLLAVLLVAMTFACAPSSGAAAGPWYVTALDRDTSYLPMGEVRYRIEERSFPDRVKADLYLPEASGAPVVLFLPGAFVVKERYYWLGSVLASHGVAVVIVQPPSSLSKATHTTQALAALEGLDLSRVILAGHSLGAFVQSALADVATCSPGFCPPGTRLPSGVRGMMLFGFHAQDPDDASKPVAPMAAIEAPWLIVNGTADGLTTPEKAEATFARLLDRPSTLVAIEGMNHYQLTDYVDEAADQGLSRDKVPTIDSKEARALVARYAVRFAKNALLGRDAPEIADPRARVTNKPPRTSIGDAGLPRVRFEPFAAPGLDGSEDNTDVVATRAFKGATYVLTRNDVRGGAVYRVAQGKVEDVGFPGRTPSLNAMFGAMEVFKDVLYVGVSSGTQGAKRASTGGEVWAYDGSAWRAVVARRADEDTTVTIVSCTAEGATADVPLTDGTLDDVDDGGPDPLILDVRDGVARYQETAQSAMPCDRVPAGKRMKHRRGTDESGFGQPWNKAITSMTVDEGTLYVGTGLNYIFGAEVWATTDGARFERVLGAETLGTHTSGTPKSSSVTAMLGTLVALNGTENYGARLYDLRQRTWLIDEGAPIPAGLGRGTFQIASMAKHDGKVWLGGFDFNGLEIFRLDPFRVEVGDGGGIARGFGDVMQIAANLTVARGDLWVGTFAGVSTAKDLEDLSAFALRSRDGQRWQLASAHGLGRHAVGVTRFFEQDAELYAIASRGSLSQRASYGPLRAYVVREENGGRP
jgi:pimeloyl-ACP methyl ester carboxylesterase